MISKASMIQRIVLTAALGLLAACSPYIPVTGGAAPAPTLVNTAVVPTSPPPTAAPQVVTVVVTATPAATAVPATPVPATAVPAAATPAPTMPMSMPTATPQSAAQQPAPAQPQQPSMVNGALQISIANFAFSPAALTIPAGTKVRWMNSDSTAHTVTADNGTFDSGPLNPGQTFAVTFSQPGTYTYHCKIHPTMVGKIIVTGAGGAIPNSGSSGGMNGSSGGQSGGSSGGSSNGGHGGGYNY